MKEIPTCVGTKKASPCGKASHWSSRLLSGSNHEPPLSDSTQLH